MHQGDDSAKYLVLSLGFLSAFFTCHTLVLINTFSLYPSNVSRKLIRNIQFTVFHSISLIQIFSVLLLLLYQSLFDQKKTKGSEPNGSKAPLLGSE